MTRDERDVIDLFAGPGGWDTGLRLTGFTGDVVGIEHDAEACATARKAGHDRMCADVSAVDPMLWFAVWLAILSPPCQAWSTAGKGLGLRDQDRIWQHVRDVDRAGKWVDYPRNYHPIDPKGIVFPRGNTWWDDRSPLVLEVLRWVLLARPRNVACEQVPAVLPFWRELARIFRGLGYQAVAFIASAEEYGVAQTRKRAILMASLDQPVAPPAPTHQRYEPGVPAQAGEADLFGGGLAPWVSMAEALGWSDGGALVGFPRRADTPSNGVAGLSGGDTRVIELDGQLYRARDLRSSDQPAQVLTEKVRSWEIHGLRNGNQANAAMRVPDEPAGTMFFGDRANAVDWALSQGDREKATERPLNEPAPTVLCSRPGNLNWALMSAGQTGEGRPRPSSAPAPALTGKGNAVWTAERPATTVCGDARIGAPGHRDREGGERQFESPETVRVTVAQAGVLQSFPADYPWQGSKTAQYRQVGDAVPPLLARAILEPFVAASSSERAA